MIGFTCTTIFHYVHFKRIASYFGSRAIFILATPQHTNNRYEKLRSYLESCGASYCDAKDIISGAVKLEAVVAPYYMPLFSFMDKDIVKVRMLYGYAKDAWNYADWNAGFDMILAYGPYSQRKLERFAPTVSVGHPRFKGQQAAEQAEVFDVEGGRLTEWLAASKREKLLYCPTWGDLSSFDWFKNAIAQLAQRYDLIIKLHHGISLSKNFTVDELIQDRLFICDETADLFDLFPVSDAVISDYSGAIFDAILANRRIVLVNSLPEPVADTGILNIKKMSNIAGGPEGIQEASLDMQMRDILPNADSPEELVQLVSAALAAPDPDYNALNQDLYEYEDDQAAYRAFEAVERAIAKGPLAERTETAPYIAFSPAALFQFVQRHADKRFIVWGAGDYGQLIIAWLVSGGYEVIAVLDADEEKQGKAVYGVDIHSPKQFTYAAEDCLILAFHQPKQSPLLDSLPQHMAAKEQIVIPFH